MADVLTSKQRSYNMSCIRAKDTSPEMAVRRLVYSLGFRYRLHSKHLPGKPDLVFGSKKKVILVHGCFFHRHECRYGSATPKTRAAFWQEKFRRNVQRDEFVRDELKRLGWRIMVIWECEIKAPTLKDRVVKYLG